MRYKRFAISHERAREISPYSPYARFEIPSTETDWLYLRYIENLLVQVIFTADQRKNVFVHPHFEPVSGEQGELGEFHLLGAVFRGCQLFWFDGEIRPTGPLWRKGLIFCEDEEATIYTVDQIFLLADMFAGYLTDRKIPFILFVRYRSNQVEKIRARFTIPPVLVH